MEQTENKQQNKDKGGRPKGATKRSEINKKIGEGVSKLDEEKVQKLCDAFAIDLTIEEACDYADISKQTYFNWVEKKPQLLDRFDTFKSKLSIKAKYNIAQRIHAGDVPLSERYLARKQPDEYADTLRIKHSGEISGDISKEKKDAIAKFHENLKEINKKKIMQKAKEDGEI